MLSKNILLTTKMGCIEVSLGRQAFDDKITWQSKEKIQLRLLHIFQSISLENKDNTDLTADLMIRIFQQSSKNRQDLLQALQQKYNIGQCEKDRTLIALLQAKILNKLNLLEKAALLYDKVIQINPKHQQSYLLLADIFYKLQRYEDFMSLLQSGHRNIPEDKEIIRKVCIFCERVNQHDKAAQFYEKLIILQPDNYHNYYQYAKNDLKSDNYHIAKSSNFLFQGSYLQEAQLGVKQGKRSHQFYYLHGYLFYRLRKYKVALKMVKISIQIHKLFQPSYYLLRMIYNALGLKEAEKAVILEVLDLYPHSKKSQNLLANFYWGQEQYDSAARVVQKILENKDDTQILHTFMVAKVFNYAGQPKKAEQYLFSLLKKCKTASQKQAIYCKIVDMHSFNSNWLMAYHFTCIRNRDTERKLSDNIQLASLCLKLNKTNEFLSLIDQTQRKIEVLYLSSIIQFIQVLQQAKRYDQCLQIYDTHFIVSKIKLKPTNQAKLNVIIANCFYQLGKMDELMEIVSDLQSLVKFIDRWPVYLIVDYMNICYKLWNYERLKHLYGVFVMRVNRRQINGYKWGEMRYQESLTKYRDILLEEERRIAVTPQ